MKAAAETSAASGLVDTLTLEARIRAAHIVDGYYNPPEASDCGKATVAGKFATAKAWATHFSAEFIEVVKNLTLADFLAGMSGKKMSPPQRLGAAYAVDQHYKTGPYPISNADAEKELVAAKAACVDRLRTQMREVKSLRLAEFLTGRRGK